MVVVPDGRIDYDKLLELLAEPDEGHFLDLKARIDLDAKADQLKLIKDLVTMSNRPPGGYLLIGADDSGKPCMAAGTIADRRRFDGARLGDLVRSNIEGQIHIRAQVHDHNGNELVLIWVENTELPVPFSKLGQYRDDKGRTQTVFRPGDIFVREGAQNVPIRNSHWPDLLSAYTKRIRSDAGDLAETVMREFINQFRQHAPGSTAAIPLLMEMDEKTFADAAAALIEEKNDVRLRQFIRTLRSSVNATSAIEECEFGLDKWTIFSAQTTLFERDDLTESAIAALYDAYRDLGEGLDSTRKRLAVVIRIYTLGSLMVRMAAWKILHSLVIRPVSWRPNDAWVYSSWIRHAQVEASRAGLIKDDRGGFLISAARELMVGHPAMRPDIGDNEIPPLDKINSHDILLNSLCQFDIAYCFVVAAEGTGKGEFYPSAAAFSEDRAKPIALKIVDDPKVRRELFPNSNDERVGDALGLVYHRTVKESANYGGRWWSAPQQVTRFIDDNGGPRLYS
jgi:hypothetical protein